MSLEQGVSSPRIILTQNTITLPFTAGIDWIGFQITGATITVSLSSLLDPCDRILASDFPITGSTIYNTLLSTKLILSALGNHYYISGVFPFNSVKDLLDMVFFATKTSTAQSVDASHYSSSPNPVADFLVASQDFPFDGIKLLSCIYIYL